MKRLTERDEDGYVYTGIDTNCVNGCYDIWDKKWLDDALDRHAAIEDILGDEYELDRLRELVEADMDGCCVVLTGKDNKNETIRDLVKTLQWVSDAVKKHDFSPFRIVAGAPENTFPVVRECQRVTDKHDEEIYLAFKDEEVGNYLKGEQDV